ncbi:CD225/dispanin family protein [Lacinutrix venerupis]|uniref:Interferon-induced transmembrane protein n=1 Tax=Lacinutrix venerupis TaxID=1486034 RepID=A0AAC9LK76_9FLAO|nr:CD225/dispanin family protein [Lacinutrix venerupis]APY00181.1 hypothetical protein BWR22_07590 [Lacinutrix venerupis]
MDQRLQNQKNYSEHMPPPRPSNHLVLAILCTVACCMPLGIVSIVYSTKVDSAYNAGDYALAESSSKKAKNWGIAGISSGFIVVIIYILFMVVFAAAGALDA